MFSTAAQENVGYYVYALFDPRSEKVPFYIGKGCGNRVFQHAAGNMAETSIDEPMSAKLQQIQEIKARGDRVTHKIIRFGLSEEEALLIEASLIDLVNHITPETLTNQISGQGVAEGIIDANDLATALDAEPLDSEQPLLIIKIEKRWSELLLKHRSATAVPLAAIYEATQGFWKVSPARASRADCILSVARGIVRAVFVPTGWIDSAYPGRKQFAGHTDASQYSAFVGKSVAHYFKRGGQNPVRYLRC